MAKRFDLSKKVPQNPKFANVKSVLDTGSSVSKYKDHLEYLRANYKFKKDEIFKRIKASTFAQLVVEVVDAEADMDLQELDEAAAMAAPSDAPAPPTPGAGDDAASVRTDTTSATARSGFLSLIHGVSERDTAPAAAAATPAPSNCPFLLLDLRDPDDFKAGHISGAISYPTAMLSRATNVYTAEMYQYINKPGRIVVVYDEDERIAPAAATLFVQRGVDNIFMLSGGLKVLLQKFPSGFYEGVVPASCIPPPAPKTASRTSSLSTSTATSRTTSRAGSTSTPATPIRAAPGRTAAASAAAATPAAAASDVFEAPPATPSGPVRVLPLTRDNVEAIRSQLEQVLLEEDARSTASSRTARAPATPSGTPARSTAATPRAGATPSQRAGAATPGRPAATSRATGRP